MLFVCQPKILHEHFLQFPQEKLKTMLMQNFGVTNKEHYGMLWHFLEWSISSNEDFRILRIQDSNEENSAVRRIKVNFAAALDRTEHKMV